jgi:oxygen-independent coproporphyrinogen-3 oxidase
MTDQAQGIARMQDTNQATHGRSQVERVDLARLFANEGADAFADAFSGSHPVHPFVGLGPVPQDSVGAIWQEMTDRPRQQTSVAYVHVPYCVNRCLFCGFYQNAWRDSEGPVYVDALIEQLRRDRDRPYQAGAPVRAVYFGGGTPTLLSARDLSRAIEAVRTYLPLAPDCEITVEGRVHGFDLDKAAAAFDAGANRLSLGVQTFDEDLRRRLGRKTDRRALIAFLEALLRMDRGAVVIDLIFGLPAQDAAVWETDVGTAIALGMDGVDLYSLKLMRDTPLAHAAETGKLTPAPAEALGAYYRAGAELMQAARWEALSASHWRSGTRERNLYNLLVKSGADCLAYGAGAGGTLHGPDGAYAYRNMADPAHYRECIARGEPVVAGLMRQAPQAPLYNRVKAGMELGHLDLRTLVDLPACPPDFDPRRALGPLLDQWQRAGLLTRDGHWADLTLAGRFWQVRMTQNLLLWLSQALDAANATPQAPPSTDRHHRQ